MGVAKPALGLLLGCAFRAPGLGDSSFRSRRCTNFEFDGVGAPAWLEGFLCSTGECYEHGGDQTLFWVLVIFSFCSCQMSGLSSLDAPGDFQVYGEAGGALVDFIRDFRQERLGVLVQLVSPSGRR